MMERAPPNDMVHVKLKISNVPKTKHRLRLGNKENEALVDLGNKPSYNFKGKPVLAWLSISRLGYCVLRKCKKGRILTYCRCALSVLPKHSSEVFAGAYNEFATAKSSNVTVKDVVLDV